MAKLSLPITHIKPHYTIVVIGSGYGGGIAASRLARAGQQVCLLERGKEFQMGEFPNTLFKANKAMQLDTSVMQFGSKTALFDLRFNKEMNALVGCGLGGTSLINAGVMLETNPYIFENIKWPKEFTNDKDGLATARQHALEMLKGSPYPKNFPNLKKLEVLEKSAEKLGAVCYRPPIAVNFAEAGINHVGVEQKPCNLCGDCIAGCNYTSKNTVQMNYLPDAWNHGAEIFTETKVRYIEKCGEKWLVHFDSMNTGREKFQAPPLFVSADIVILSAGTLGTTEILLRSKQLSLSDELGKNLTGNGGFMGFGYNADEVVNGIGCGTRKPDPNNPVGPCITGVIDSRNPSRHYLECMSIEEGTIPGSLKSLLPITFYLNDKLTGTRTWTGWKAYFKAKFREFISLFGGSYRGAVNRTQIYLATTHDSSQGKMYLEKDRLRIEWPNVGKEEVFQYAKRNFQRLSSSVGGTFIPNPIWTKLFNYKLITVHPLGGCIMGTDASTAVANHKGQIFAGKQGKEVHQGLYVSDASIIPTTLGTNPLVTISTISERNIAILAKEHGWILNYDLPSKPVKVVPPPQVGFQFTETMIGHLSTKETEDYKLAAKLGKQENSTFEFTLTVLSEDVQEMLINEEHQANMFGTVNASALSDKPLMVTEAIFNLFVKYPDDANIQWMRYSMKLHAQDGKNYYFEGVKKIRHASIFSIWSETTTLYITVYDGENEKAPVLGKGIVKIRLRDFIKQMRTLKVINAAGKFEALKYTAQFGKFFTSKLFENYGGIFGGWNYFNPDVSPRQQRPLRVSAPEIHEFTTADKVKLRLTRYQGGAKGPVILVHGAGVSSKIFSTDTVDTNLLEYLFANEYDVWLLDYRASIELPSANTQFTADDVAKYDYPAAVETVLKITEADSVQFVAHCYGATTLSISLLGGWLTGIRAVVYSQVSIHNKTPFLTRIKTGLYVPTLLNKLGIKTLTAYVTSNSRWWERAFNTVLALFHPMQQRCNHPVCYRISFMYGQLYQHEQLNQLTHENMHEMFGVINMTTLEHLALMVRKGKLVNSQGEDCYLPHLERMAIPTTFISGEENKCFLPESTEITYNNLCEKNGKDLYKRVVIPNYGHIDCIFGKNAVRDVYPSILNHLEETD